MKKTSFVFMALVLFGLALSGCEDSTYGNFTGNYTGDTNTDTTGDGTTTGTGTDSGITTGTETDTGSGAGTGTTGNIVIDTSDDTTTDYTTDTGTTGDGTTSTSTTINDDEDDMTTADDEDDSSISIETMTVYDTNSREVNYYNDVDGFYAYPSEIGGGREYPGVIIVHEGFGLDNDVETYAENLASYGFLVLAIDLREEAGMTTTPNNNDEDENETEDEEQDEGSIEDLDQQDAWRNIRGAESFLRDKGADNIALVSCTSHTTAFEAEGGMTTSTTSSDDEEIIAYFGDENLCVSAEDADSGDLDESMEDTVEFLAMNLMNETDNGMTTEDDDN
ncbi:MAG TPA: dienelactone hydrolase family protein [Alphaproteobacteria bacterium]|nr:dienelactone hydrolase family protein [Alphaproteobacteria bacterium]